MLRPHGLEPTRLLCLWGFSRQEHWSGLPCAPPDRVPFQIDFYQIKSKILTRLSLNFNKVRQDSQEILKNKKQILDSALSLSMEPWQRPQGMYRGYFLK